MLLKLRGREHLVTTGFALLRIPDGEIRVGHETTRVWFSNMSDEEVDAYAVSEEPLDKAGAYAIQGSRADNSTNRRMLLQCSWIAAGACLASVEGSRLAQLLI